MARNKRFVFFLLLLFFAFLAIFKIIRLYTLGYSIDDLPNNLEGSYSWLLGRPITYANGYGQMNHAHNYFLMPLLGPIILLGGTEAIFIFYALLCFWSVWQFAEFNQINSLHGLFVVLILFLNPTFIWIFDHPEVGWSMELLYYPLAILLALALKFKKKPLIYLFTILLSLVREEGIIIVCFIWLFHYILVKTKTEKFNLLSYFPDRKLWLIAASFSIIFLFSMLYLTYKSDNESFAKDALQMSSNFSFFGENSIVNFLQATLLLLPNILLLILIGKPTKPQLGFYMLFCLLLLLLTLFQTIRYYDKFFYEIVTMTWAPRFIIPFTFTISSIVLLFEANKGIVNRKKWEKTFLFLVIFLGQAILISFFRKDVSYSKLFKTITTLEPQNGIKKLIDKEDLSFVRKIEKNIPKHSSIYTCDYLLPLFLDHYIVWPSRKSNFEKADIGIIPADSSFLLLMNDLKISMKPNYKYMGVHGAYQIYCTEQFEKYIPKK